MNLESLNRHTQPADEHRMFNNWQRLPEAWYFTVRTRALKSGQVTSIQILNQKLVIFRDDFGFVHALDSFCPHMGLDLSLGKVVGRNLRCFFHHWQYGGNGRCKKIPALGRELSSDGVDMGLKSYPTTEKYGLIWVYAGYKPKVPVLEVPELEGKEVQFHLGKINTNRSHHHISMINGLDPQHLKTVHELSIEMNIQVVQDQQQISFVLEGDVPTTKIIDRVMRWLFGPRYSYSMKYSQASVASLTLLRNVFFRKPSRVWPRLHMLYAYRPVHQGLCETQPIYITEKRKGLWGHLKSRLTLWLTRQAYFFLKDDDDKIYDHIRFDSRRLLPIDKPVSKYIDFVNGLDDSIWSSDKIGGSECTPHKVDTEFTAGFQTTQI